MLDYRDWAASSLCFSSRTRDRPSTLMRTRMRFCAGSAWKRRQNEAAALSDAGIPFEMYRVFASTYLQLTTTAASRISRAWWWWRQRSGPLVLVVYGLAAPSGPELPGAIRGELKWGLRDPFILHPPLDPWFNNYSNIYIMFTLLLFIIVKLEKKENTNFAAMILWPDPHHYLIMALE